MPTRSASRSDSLDHIQWAFRLSRREGTGQIRLRRVKSLGEVCIRVAADADSLIAETDQPVAADDQSNRLERMLSQCVRTELQHSV